MIKKLFLLLIIISLYSCQSVKDALSGKKYESSDEFLVIKKNPLVLPPDFNELPKPEDPVSMTRQESIEAEIDDMLSSIKSEEDQEIKVELIKIGKDISKEYFQYQYPDAIGFPYVIVDDEHIGGLVETAKLLLRKGFVSTKKK